MSQTPFALRSRAAGARESAPPRGFTRGFTLLEVLLCIALIALLGGVLVGSSSQLLSPQPSTPHAVFWKAVQEARKTALKSDHEIRLKYDREKKHFYLVDGLAPSTLAEDGFTRVETPLKTFPIAAETAQDLTIDFLAASSKGGNTILVGGMLLESKPVPYVSFYSDGTCRAFRAQFARSGSSSILSIDPWTCAPVLPAADPNAP
jgi:prepilin-type N-terminal cleavage/methylation domain-containing protein